MSYKAIMNLIPTIQAAALVSANVKQAKKKQNVKSITELGVTNIVGTSLIQVEAGLIGGL